MSRIPIRNAFHLALLPLFIGGLVSCSGMFKKESKIEVDTIKAERNHKALVFVHGVLGDHEETWTASKSWLRTIADSVRKILGDQSDGSTNSFKSWPRLIAESPKYSQYDVYVVSYPTKLDESPAIFKLGQDLNKELYYRNILPNDIDTQTNYDQVIFVAHSMGNLVVLSAFLANNPALELKVPLLLSIAAPWNGSDLAERASFFFNLNPQFREMVKFHKNSFLQLLKQNWHSRKREIIRCVSEGKDYTWLGIFGATVVSTDSAGELCTPEARAHFAEEDHSSIVKPESLDHPIHTWLDKQLTENENQEMPWKLRRWRGEETIDGGKRRYVCEIRIAGKEFHESNILMQMMVLVIEDRVKQLGKDAKCAGSHLAKDHEHIIIIKPLYDHGDAPTVLAELKHQNIDIYAEYSGALLYSHLNEIPVPPLSQSSEEDLHDPQHINKLMSKSEHPDFHKMQLLSSFGFDSGIELVMLRSTAEQLHMLRDGDTTVTYDEIVANGHQLAFVGDRDLFKRRDALGGLKAKFPAFAPRKEDPLYHEEIYEALDKSDCQVSRQSEYCQGPLNGSVAIGFKTDPQANDAKYVKVVASGGYEFPKHSASPMVHKFLDHAFPGLKPTETLEKLKGKIFNGDMLELVKQAQGLEAEASVVSHK